MGNGRLDLNALTKVDGWAYLSPNTAVAWNGACDELVSLGDPRPAITAPDGAYRDLAGQRYWKKYWTGRGKPGNAATPGYSNHGWGTAVDIWDVAKFPRAVLRDVFARWGFTFNVPTEDWHTQHDGKARSAVASTTSAIIEEEESNMHLIRHPSGAIALFARPGVFEVLNSNTYPMYKRILKKDFVNVSAEEYAQAQLDAAKDRK